MTCLVLYSFIPPQVDHDALVCHREIETNSTSSQGRDEDMYILIVSEIFDLIFSRRKGHLSGHLCRKMMLVMTGR